MLATCTGTQDFCKYVASIVIEWDAPNILFVKDFTDTIAQNASCGVCSTRIAMQKLDVWKWTQGSEKIKLV